MAAVFHPPWVAPEKETVVPTDDSTVAFEPAFARGNSQRQNYADPRPVLSRMYRGLSALDRAALTSFGWRLKGRFNKFHAPFGYTRRGGFSTSELCTDPYFVNGTSNYTVNSAYSMTVHDRRARLKHLSNPGAASIIFRHTNAFATTAYAPYLGRVMACPATYDTDEYQIAFGSSANGTDYGVATDFRPGLLQSVVVPPGTSVHMAFRHGNESVFVAGDSFDVDYFSFARCSVLDSGHNLLLQSDAYNTASWTATRSSVTANAEAGPTGNNVAERLIEDSSNNTHYIEQAVTVASTTGLDYHFQIYVEGSTRTFCRISMVEGTSNHECYIDVNLTTGAKGTATASGANWVNPRAFVRDAGEGWWLIDIIGQKASAATSVTCRAYMASALGTISYSGNGSSRIHLWRSRFRQASLPGRPMAGQTQSTQYTTEQTGDLIWLTGLEASQTELLLPGDVIGVDEDWHVVATALNSDAAGVGGVRIEPALANSKADKTPVVIHNPMGAFCLADDLSYENLFGVYADMELRFCAVYE